MIALPYDYVLIAWFVLAAASTAYVAFDQFNGNPEPTVMKWGFILVTLYMGRSGFCCTCSRTRNLVPESMSISRRP